MQFVFGRRSHPGRFEPAVNVHPKEDHVGYFAALDVSQEQTAICVVDERGAIVAEAKVSTCPDTIFAWFEKKKLILEKLGMETGPLAVWLWNELKARGLPIICIDARHANAALKMMPNKTDRNDAIGLADHPHRMVQGSSDQEPWRLCHPISAQSA